MARAAAFEQFYDLIKIRKTLFYILIINFVLDVGQSPSEKWLVGERKRGRLCEICRFIIEVM